MGHKTCLVVPIVVFMSLISLSAACKLTLLKVGIFEIANCMQHDLSITILRIRRARKMVMSGQGHVTIDPSTLTSKLI